MLKALLFCVLFLGSKVFYGQEKYLHYLSADTLKESVYILASDSLEGRETGEPGQKKAAQYILKQFSDAGLRTGKDTAFLQEYELRVKPSGGSEFSLGNNKAVFMKDYFFFPGFADFSIEKEELTAFCPHNLAGLKNRLVLIDVQSDPEQLKEKVGKAREAGSRAVFVLIDDLEKLAEKNEHRINKSMVRLSESEENEGFPVIYVDKSFFYAGKSKKIVHSCKNEKSCKGHALSIPFAFSVNRKEKIVTGENVIAYYQGESDETIVISAHYDHLGVIDGKIYYGADDNASGTAGIISLSKALGRFVKSDAKGRSVLFIAFSGEEKGLLGSSYYVAHPFIPLEKTYANINIDMIGRKDATYKDSLPYIYVIGAGRISNDLLELTEKANASAGLILDYTYDDPKDPNRFYYRSDHYNFARNGIPVVFFFNGVHKDYHKHTDTRDKILPGLMEERVKLAYYLAVELINREGELKKNTTE